MSLFMEAIEKSMSSLAEFSWHHSGPYFVCYEVFGIRIRWDGNTSSWQYSTKRKENAFQSFWAERRSFGNLFRDEIRQVCGESHFMDALKRDVDYYFLVPLRRRNRVLLSKEEEESFPATVFLAGIVEHETQRASLLTSAEDRSAWIGPWSFLPLTTPDAYEPDAFPHSIGISYCNIDATACPECPERENDTPRLVRFLLRRYQKRREWRANVADIYVRYGQLWHERSPYLNDYRMHYSEYIEPFEAAIEDLFILYQQRYVDNIYAKTSPLRHAILKKIKEYQRRRRWDVVTKNNVYSIVFQHFETKLYKI